MFGHTTFSIAPRFSKASFERRSGSPSSRPQSPPSAPIPQPGLSSLASNKPYQHNYKAMRRSNPSSTDYLMSEQYTNKAFHRLPSPASRIKRSECGYKSEREVTRPQGLSTASRSHKQAQEVISPRLTNTIKTERDAKERGRTQTIIKPRVHSAVSSVRQTPFQERCTLKVPSQPRPRPHTADSPRDTLGNKMMVTVKEVLSRAVLERGHIDEHNIDTILHDMRSCLRLEDGEEADMGEKANSFSGTTGNEKMRPLAGIVRKDLADSMKPPQSTYKRVYNEGLQRRSSNRVVDNDPDSIIFIDLPDPDHSNFNYVVKRQLTQSNLSQPRANNNGSRSGTTFSVEVCPHKATEEEVPSYMDEMVGDGECTDNRPITVWKESDDTKLQRYISTLINNLNGQLTKNSEAGEGEFDTKSTICKSFCVCKVCATDKCLNKNAEQPFRTRTGNFDMRLNPSIRDSPSISSSLRQPVAKESRGSTNLRVLKTAQDFKLDSQSRLNNYSQSCDVPSKVTQTPEPVDEEAREEMYLQRRLRRSAPVKRK